MRLQGIFSEPLLWLAKLPIRVLVFPFAFIVFGLIAKITIPGGLSCAAINDSLIRWAITLPVRLTIGVVIVVFLLLLGDLEA